MKSKIPQKRYSSMGIVASEILLLDMKLQTCDADFKFPRGHI
jgi:hypothetical protein